MADHIPTTEETRERIGVFPTYGGRQKWLDDFDAWFAEEIRKAKYDGWYEGFEAGVNYDTGDYEVPPEPLINPYKEKTS